MSNGFRGQRKHFGRVCGLLLMLGACSGCDHWDHAFATEDTSGLGGTGGDTSDPLTTNPPAECPGVCVRAASVPFERVTVFSIGKPDEVRPCSDLGTYQGFVGVRDMTVAQPSCPSCSCGPAACVLPESMSAGAATCPADGAEQTPFDAPPAWEGNCTAENAIAKDLSCGDLGPCVASLTVEAPIVAPCAPVETGAVDIPDPEFGTLARECLIQPTPEGCDLGEACIPKLPDGFRACLFLPGDDPAYGCPEEVYTDRVVVYSLADSRACEPCGCGDPEGASCSALVSVFEDGECGSLLGTFPVTAPQGKACFDLPPGAALGSKEAKWTVDKLGNCPPSGGELKGSIALTGPVTLCCQPEGSPAP